MLHKAMNFLINTNMKKVRVKEIIPALAPRSGRSCHGLKLLHNVHQESD